MKKRHVQGALCAIAVAHIYLSGPVMAEGQLSMDYGLHFIYYMAWAIKRLLQIPLIYGFLILGVQFLWPSAHARQAAQTPENDRTGEHDTAPDGSRHR